MTPAEAWAAIIASGKPTYCGSPTPDVEPEPFAEQADEWERVKSARDRHYSTTNIFNRVQRRID
jgi:hypothetical protein